MNLKQFADMAGCKVVLCGPGWGGRYGYTTDDAPNCTTCGFKTKSEARERWMADTFGELAGAAVQKLLSSNDPGKQPATTNHTKDENNG